MRSREVFKTLGEIALCLLPPESYKLQKATKNEKTFKLGGSSIIAAMIEGF